MVLGVELGRPLDRHLHILSWCLPHRRHAMRGRLYYTAKAKKKGKQMIKIHPCSRLFFCKCCVCFKEVKHRQET